MNALIQQHFESIDIESPAASYPIKFFAKMFLRGGKITYEETSDSGRLLFSQDRLYLLYYPLVHSPKEHGVNNIPVPK